MRILMYLHCLLPAVELAEVYRDAHAIKWMQVEVKNNKFISGAFLLKTSFNESDNFSAIVYQVTVDGPLAEESDYCASVVDIVRGHQDLQLRHGLIFIPFHHWSECLVDAVTRPGHWLLLARRYVRAWY